MRSRTIKQYTVCILLCVGFFTHISFAENIFFSKTLLRGSSGVDVQNLQSFLKSPPNGGVDIYPEGIVSGYYGTLTESAVKRFQKKYGIETLGIVGPKTRTKLNELAAVKKETPQPISSQSPTSQLPKCATPTATNCEKTKNSNAFDPSGGKCVGTGPVMFGASPFKIAELEIVQPMGATVGGHVTPIDHGYMFGKGTPNVVPDTFDIQSPAKGYVVDISRTQRGDFSDHALTIEFSCTHYVKYSNMTSFAPKLLQAAGGSVGINETKNIRVAVSEGDLVGKTGAYGIDLYVWDLEKTLTGFVNQKSYSESWKVHSAQLFDYLKEPLKSQLLAKTARQAEPRFGKIDYDIDGRLVGNWFKKGTNGYAGLNNGAEGYWSGHLSIAYDSIDPAGIVVSIGNWPGEAAQFGIRGNAPDPKDVSTATGLIKYELLRRNWIIASTGEPWTNRYPVPDVQFHPIDDGQNALQGVILLQLVEPRTLKAEVFPGKTAAQVSDFTPASVVYER